MDSKNIIAELNRLGLTRYRIAKRTGITASSLMRIMQRPAGTEQFQTQQKLEKLLREEQAKLQTPQ